MTTPAVSAAAERLRTGFTYAHCPDHWEECNDARALAEAYLAEHDETPYSGDFWGECPGLALSVTADNRGRWWAEAHQDGMRIVLSEIKTRGDLTRLAAALGIDLPSPGANP